MQCAGRAQEISRGENGSQPCEFHIPRLETGLSVFEWPAMRHSTGPAGNRPRRQRLRAVGIGGRCGRKASRRRVGPIRAMPVSTNYTACPPISNFQKLEIPCLTPTSKPVLDEKKCDGRRFRLRLVVDLLTIIALCQTALWELHGISPKTIENHRQGELNHD
jgi:hypothetical protein